MGYCGYSEPIPGTTCKPLIIPSRSNDVIYHELKDVIDDSKRDLKEIEEMNQEIDESMKTLSCHVDNLESNICQVGNSLSSFGCDDLKDKMKRAQSQSMFEEKVNDLREEKIRGLCEFQKRFEAKTNMFDQRVNDLRTEKVKGSSEFQRRLEAQINKFERDIEKRRYVKSTIREPKPPQTVSSSLSTNRHDRPARTMMKATKINFPKIDWSALGKPFKDAWVWVENWLKT